MDIEEPAEFISIGTAGELTLDQNSLKQILRKFSPPFVVLSVIGNPASGKSFLLNYILRYLRGGGIKNWIQKPNDQLDGFIWNQLVDGDNEDRNGIRVYHQPLVIEEEEGNGLSLVLFDIDFYRDSEEFAVQYAALEAICLEISNAAIFVDSNKDVKNNQKIQYIFGQILKQLSDNSVKKMKYVLNNIAQGIKNSENSELVLNDICLRSRLNSLDYMFPTSAGGPASFKGEYKHIVSLQNFKGFLTSCFSIDELIVCTNSPGKNYKTAEELVSKLNSVVSHMRQILLSNDLNTMLEAYEQDLGQAALLTSNSGMPTTSREDAGPIRRDPANINSEPKNAVEAKNESISDPEYNLDMCQSALTNQELVGIEFTEKLHQIILSNLPYFVPQDTRARFLDVIKVFVTAKLSERYGEEYTEKFLQLIGTKIQEHMKTLRPVTAAIEKYENKAENEFDSELYLADEELEVVLQNARSFATSRYKSSENQKLDSIFSQCLDVSDRIYMDRNKLIRDAELKLMKEAALIVASFYKNRFISALTEENVLLPNDLTELKDEFKELVVNTFMACKYRVKQENFAAFTEIVNISFDEIAHHNSNNLAIIEHSYKELILDCLTSYEHKFRSRVEEGKNREHLTGSHCELKNYTLQTFQNRARKSNLVGVYVDHLDNLIESSFKQQLEHYDRKSFKQRQLPASSLSLDSSRTNSSNSVSTDPAVREVVSIGIHFVRYKIRCSSYIEGKFYQIPIDGPSKSSTAMPDYFGVNRDSNIVLGVEAKRTYDCNRDKAFKVSEIRPGEEIQIKGRGALIKTRLEVIVAYILQRVVKDAAAFLKRDIGHCVIAVSSLADHSYKKCIIDAAALAGIKDTLIISEACAASSKYLHHVQQNPKCTGIPKSLMIVYQTDKDESEIARIHVSQNNINVICTSASYYDKTIINPFIQGAKYLQRLLSGRANPNQSEISSKSSDQLILVGDGNGKTKTKYNTEASPSFVDNATGVVDGASYYAASNTTTNPIFLQQCIPYDLVTVHNGCERILFKRNSPFPLEDDVVILLTNNNNINEVRIEVNAVYSSTNIKHTHSITFVGTEASVAGYNSVEFCLKVSPQGELNVTGYLCDSGTKKRKEVNINIISLMNLNRLEFEKCREGLERLLS